jgi:AAA family ATP:ADP antiporter
MALHRLLAPIADVRKEETGGILLMFAYSFLAMTAYNILKPITRSLFINRLGAEQLPWVILAAGIAIGFIMQAYSRTVGLVPRRWVIPAAQGAMIALLVAFWFLFRTGAAWVAVAFYLFGLILGILLISQFWTLANDIYDPRQAKRLFGFIGGGASLGGMTGSAILTFFVQRVGTNNLLLVSASILALCVLIVIAVVSRSKAELAGITETGEESGVGGKEALRLLRESKHLQVIAMVIGFAAVGAAIIEQQLNMAAEAFKGAANTDAVTQFLGQVQFFLSFLGFVIQVWLTSRIQRLLGIGFALLILPVSLGATAVVMLLNAALWAPALARILDTSLRYTVDKTTREILFLPLPSDLKFRAKPFVDVTMDRLSKGLAALLILVLISDWGLDLDWQQVSWASLAICGLWIAAAQRARRGYQEALRRSLERRDVAPADVRLAVGDLQTVETLIETLADPDERRVIYAIDILESLDKRHLVTPLLLHHASPRVRRRALEALAAARPETARPWLPHVERMLHDADAGVRVAALRALAAIREETVADLVRPLLDEPEPRVASAAAIVLAQAGRDDDRDAAVAALERLAASLSPAARRDVAAAIGPHAPEALHTVLVPLLSDPDPGVARQAIRSVRTLGAASVLFVPALVSLLGNRRLKSEAREVLVSYGEAVVPALAHFLRDPGEDLWVRRHIPATLARIPSQASMDALVAALAAERDGFLRFKLLSAIDRLHREQPALAFDRRPLERLALQQARAWFAWLGLHHNLFVRAGLAGGSLLEQALREKMARGVDRLYLLLGILHPWQDVAAARWAIERGDARSRSSAIEYLDNVLAGPLRKHVLPVLEDLPLDDKVRRGNVLLSTRPRDVDETLLHLVNDDDPVVSAAAIQFVARERRWTLAGDLEHVLAHRDVADYEVFEAASWALAEHRLPAAEVRRLWIEPLPAVELAARLRPLPIFAKVSVDELFRLARAGRQVRYEAGHVLCQEGQVPQGLEFLLDGSVVAATRAGGRRVLEPVAPIGFEEVIQGAAAGETFRTAAPSVCLALSLEECRTLLADNTDLVQGLFRTLLDHPRFAGDRFVVAGTAGAELARLASGETTPVERLLALQTIPAFARLAAEELLQLAGVARRVPFGPGRPVARPADPPSLLLVLEGELAIEADGLPALAAKPGDAVGLFETLAGVPLGRAVRAAGGGAALCVAHDDLVDLLGERPDLVRQIFQTLFGRRDAPGPAAAGAATAPAAIV